MALCSLIPTLAKRLQIGHLGAGLYYEPVTRFCVRHIIASLKLGIRLLFLVVYSYNGLENVDAADIVILTSLHGASKDVMSESLTAREP